VKVKWTARRHILWGLRLGPGPYWVSLASSFSLDKDKCPSPPGASFGNSSWNNVDFWSRKLPVNNNHYYYYYFCFLYDKHTCSWSRCYGHRASAVLRNKKYYYYSNCGFCLCCLFDVTKVRLNSATDLRKFWEIHVNLAKNLTRTLVMPTVSKHSRDHRTKHSTEYKLLQKKFLKHKSLQCVETDNLVLGRASSGKKSSFGT